MILIAALWVSYSEHANHFLSGVECDGLLLSVSQKEENNNKKKRSPFSHHLSPSIPLTHSLSLQKLWLYSG